LAEIASEEEINELKLIYLQHFGDLNYTITEAEEEESIDEQADRHVWKTLGDLGTEEELKKSSDELAKGLEFPNGRPILFNPEKMKYSTVDFWDAENLKSTEPREALKLEWVQLAGVTAMVRKTFGSEESSEKKAGILLADEVGMGKTAQIMAFIAFLQQVRLSDQEKRQRPPIIGEFIHLYYLEVMRRSETATHAYRVLGVARVILPGSDEAV